MVRNYRTRRPMMPKPKTVARVPDPKTGREKLIVECPECGKQVLSRGYTSHYRIAHGGETTPIMLDAAARREAANRTPDAEAAATAARKLQRSQAPRKRRTPDREDRREHDAEHDAEHDEGPDLDLFADDGESGW